MTPHRLAALLAIIALLLPAFASLAPARAERGVICGVDGPVIVLIDLATGKPVAPPSPAEGHDCCLAGAQCGGCAGAEPHTIAAPASAPRSAASQPALACSARTRHTAAGARAPPLAVA